MGAECEGVTAGEGMWWLVPLSLVRTGDSVFTVLDAEVADFKRGKKHEWIFLYNILKLAVSHKHITLDFIMYFGTILKNCQCWDYLLSWLPCVFKPLYPFYRDKEMFQELFITIFCIAVKVDSELCRRSAVVERIYHCAYCERSRWQNIFVLRESHMRWQGPRAAAFHTTSCGRGCGRGWSGSTGKTKGGGGGGGRTG